MLLIVFYNPRYSFCNYLKQKKIVNFKTWDLFRIQSKSKYIDYFMLYNSRTNDFIIFEYDSNHNELHTVDRKFPWYQERKFLFDQIKNSYTLEELFEAKELTNEIFNDFCAENDNANYTLFAYDYIVKPNSIMQ